MPIHFFNILSFILYYQTILFIFINVYYLLSSYNEKKNYFTYKAVKMKDAPDMTSNLFHFALYFHFRGIVTRK